LPAGFPPGRIEEVEMRIEILGAGSDSCRQLAENAEIAAKDLGLHYNIVLISEKKEIERFGVMTSPALAVEGRLKVVGKVASVAEIKEMLQY
jgi:small redox-active disulfide protein 2